MKRQQSGSGLTELIRCIKTQVGSGWNRM